jgi:hypothetical protein
MHTVTVTVTDSLFKHELQKSLKGPRPSSFMPHTSSQDHSTMIWSGGLGLGNTSCRGALRLCVYAFMGGAYFP